MKKKDIVKSREEDADASSSLLRIPDEIILLILNKLLDLRILCFCYLLSKRFSLLVLKVDSISFAAHLLNPRINNNTGGDVAPSRLVPPLSSSFYGESFVSATKFLSRFKRLKSLSIKLPSSSEIGNDNLRSFKWVATFGNRIESCNKIESFICLSPISVFDADGICVKGNGEQRDNQETGNAFHQNYYNAFHIATLWHTMLLEFVKNLPMLKEVSITDLGKSGRLSLSGEKLREVKEWVHADPETAFSCKEGPYAVSHGCMSVMKLPETGYEMKGVYFLVRKNRDLEGGNDDHVISKDGVEDKEEAAYSEAMIDIWRRMH